MQYLVQVLIEGNTTIADFVEANSEEEAKSIEVEKAKKYGKPILEVKISN